MVKAEAVLAILTSFLLHKGLCYPDGAPVEKCVDMTPSHGVAAQTGASPYEIKVAKPYYMPGENVTVSIESSTDNIKGFLIQARQVGANSATGMFGTLPVNVTHLACGNDKVLYNKLFHSLSWFTSHHIIRQFVLDRMQL